MNVPLLVAGALLLAPAWPGSQAAPAQAKPVSLAYRCVEGRSVPWSLSSSGEIDVYAESSATPAESSAIEVRIDTDCTGVTGDPAGRLVFDLHVRRMQMTLRGGETAMNLVMSAEGIEEDGELKRAADDEDLALVLGKMFGGPIEQVLMPAAGDVYEVAYRGDLDWEEELGEIRSASDFMLFHPILPPGPVSPGARWKGKRPVRTEYEFAEPIEIEHTLVKVADGIATIAVQGEYESREPRKARQKGKPKHFKYLRFQQKGEVRFRISDGELESGDVNVLLQATVRAPLATSAGMRIHAPMRYVLARRAPAAEKPAPKSPR